jgi:signal transduction histidine kinase
MTVVGNHLSALLLPPAPWDTQAELAAEYWVRHGNAAAVLLLGAQPAGKFTAVSVRQRSDGQITRERFNLDGTPGWLLSNNRLIEFAAETGRAVHRWPELLSAAIVQSGDNSEISPDNPAAPSLPALLCKQLLSHVSDRALLFPNKDRLEAIAEYAAGAGHEINNPLASIIGQTQLLLRSDQVLERRQAYETIGAQAWRVRDIIGNSMLFARPPQPNLQSLNLVAAIRESLEALKPSATELRVQLRLLTANEEITAAFDRALLGQLVSSLVRNSVEAIRGANRAGLVQITVRKTAPDVVSVAVLDDGPGLESDAVRHHLFNPFFSGRPAGRGLGFGLCLAWRIVQLHGGLIFAEEPSDSGLTVEFALPT